MARLRPGDIFGKKAVSVTFSDGAILVVVCGIGCFVTNLTDKERRETIREFANGWNKLGYWLIALTGVLFGIKETFNSIDTNEAFGLIPAWSVIQIGLCCFAAGINRSNRRW